MTISLEYEHPDQLPVIISDVREKIMEEKPVDFREGLLHHDEGVDLMLASISLSGIEVLSSTL